MAEQEASGSDRSADHDSDHDSSELPSSSLDEEAQGSTSENAAQDLALEQRMSRRAVEAMRKDIKVIEDRMEKSKKLKMEASGRRRWLDELIGEVNVLKGRGVSGKVIQENLHLSITDEMFENDKSVQAWWKEKRKTCASLKEFVLEFRRENLDAAYRDGVRQEIYKLEYRGESPDVFAIRVRGMFLESSRPEESREESIKEDTARLLAGKWPKMAALINERGFDQVKTVLVQTFKQHGASAFVEASATVAVKAKPAAGEDVRTEIAKQNTVAAPVASAGGARKKKGDGLHRCVSCNIRHGDEHATCEVKCSKCGIQGHASRFCPNDKKTVY